MRRFARITAGGQAVYAGSFRLDVEPAGSGLSRETADVEAADLSVVAEFVTAQEAGWESITMPTGQ
jgi:hypothetical protein